MIKTERVLHFSGHAVDEYDHCNIFRINWVSVTRDTEVRAAKNVLKIERNLPIR